VAFTSSSAKQELSYQRFALFSTKIQQQQKHGKSYFSLSLF